MMEPEARYTVVGSAVLGLLAALAAAVVWLTAASHTRELRDYRIYFARQSLEGLEVRSDVRMKGIRVGAVTGFSFSRTRPGTVEVSLGVERGAPVLEGTRAVVERNLITGLAHIRLVNESEESPPLRPPRSGEPAVIAEGESRLQQFSNTIDQLAQRADETLRRINTVLSDENQLAITETLGQVRSLAADTVEMTSRLERTLASVGASADSVRVSAASLSADVHRLAGRYDDLGRETTVGVRELGETMRRLQADVSKLTQRTAGVLTDSEVEVRTTAQQLRAAADAVTAAARRLGDPRAALFGPRPTELGPGEAR
jgi:phospholipid/cholesterol/gamma-HCH transport system substrate-binding protein